VHVPLGQYEFLVYLEADPPFTAHQIVPMHGGASA